MCEGAGPGAWRLCRPSRRGDACAGPSPPSPPRAHCGSPAEWRGRLLLEAVNFPPASGAGPGRVSQALRAGFAVGRGKFRGCPAPGDAWGRGGRGEPRQARHAGPTERRMPRRQERRGISERKKEENRGRRSLSVDGSRLGTRGNKRGEGWKSNPPGGRAERLLSGTLLSKRSAPPKKVPKFYYGHCFVPLLKRLLLLHSRYRSPTSIWEVMLGLFGVFWKTNSRRSREEQNSLQKKEAFQISTKKIKSNPEGNRSLRRQ